MSTSRDLEKMPTGVAGLDHLLCGGLLRGNSLLIEGPPGSGKTTFGVRIIHEGVVKYNEPGMIITFEEFPKQVYQESMSYGLDLAALEDSDKLRIIWTPPSRILEGFTGKNDLIDNIVGQLGVRRLVIDSVSHFKRVAGSEVELREALAKILSYLKIKGITAVLIKELEVMDEQTIAFEEYLVDASVRLLSVPSVAGGENLRMCEIRKTRGQAHISGRHPFIMSDSGLEVFPHLRVRDVRTAFEPVPVMAPLQRVSTGVLGLDQMLGGGLWGRSVSLLTGAPGTGKSVLIYHFINAGLVEGGRAMIISLKSDQSETARQSRSLGFQWDAPGLSERFRVLHFETIDLCVEQVMNRIMEVIKEFRPHRIVFDGIEDLRVMVRNEDRLRDELRLLGQLVEASGATSIMLGESADSERASGISAERFGNMARTIVHLSMEESGGEVHRHVMISKHAGSAHKQDRREFFITGQGFSVP